MFIHLSKPVECTTPGVNSTVNYGLWVIMMVHVDSSSIIKVPPLWGMLRMGESVGVEGAGGTWDISVFHSVLL